MMRIGAPLAKAPSTPSVPGDNADVGAAGNHRLLRLAGALGADRLDRDVMLGVNAGAVAELGPATNPSCRIGRRRFSACPPRLH